MSLILYINGQLADLDAGQVIAQTKQVNDLNSLESRQTNYTNKFKVPKTANNTRIMQFLTLTGNTAALPYQQNTCSLYSDTGECFVYNGRGVITDGGDSYDVVVYDGIIDLYKAIENKSLGTLNLEDLDHEKSFETITASWNAAANLPYRYILADYNGNTGAVNTTSPEVNIDYLVPSVNVAWLWAKIFGTAMTYSGSVFQSPAFTNLWMTYPKGMSTIDGELEVLNIDTYLFPNAPGGGTVRAFYFRTQEFETYDENYIQPNPVTHIKVKESSYYRIEIEGTINASYSPKIMIGKNYEQYPDAYFAPELYYLGLAIDGQPFSVQKKLFLNAGESICVYLKRRKDNMSFKFDGDRSAAVRLIKITPNNFNFTEAFTDFPIRDFLTEVVQRFGLTMYKNKYRDHYTFLTLQEQMQLTGAKDWSGKFNTKTSENYIYGSYAQRNWFRYSYNDKESSHHDGYMEVPNVNLPDSKDTVKSKIYAPERDPVLYLSKLANVYRLWDKEVVENPAEGADPIKYKPLDKRYYFLRAGLSTQAVLLKSASQNEEQAVSFCYTESYWKLPFAEIIQDYYTPLQNILNKACVVTADLWLKDTDIINFDFSKLYYFEQLSGYFIMNKINNYLPGRPTKCEMIKVQPGLVQQGVQQLFIISHYTDHLGVQIYYMATTDVGYLEIQYSTDGVTYTGAGAGNITAGINTYLIGIPLPAAGTYFVRLYQAGTGITTNAISVTVAE